MLSIKNIYSLFIIFFFYQANAQHNLKLVVQNLSATHLNDTVYVAGNFNGWNPGKTAMAFQQDKNVWEIILSLPTDQYEFKFTLGSWDNVQVTKSGKDAANNSMKLLNDTSVFFTIVAWKNEFEVLPKKHTASNHVTIMDTAFNIPQINSKRKIWVYLPEGYENNNKRYPVLYMQDGQNLFDEYTGNFGEWALTMAPTALMNTTLTTRIGLEKGKAIIICNLL